MNWIVAAALIPSLLVSWLVAWAMRVLAPRWGLVDRPGHRKVHTVPTPYGGGVAIWAGVVVPLALAQLALELCVHEPQSARPTFAFDVSSFGDWAQRTVAFVEPHLGGLLSQARGLWFFLAAGTVLMLLGLVDDVRRIDWRIRLAVQVGVAALVVVWRGWALTIFVNVPVLTSAISILWIVGLVNSFNMLDNMDGLSGSVAAIAAILLGVVMLTVSESAQQPQLFVAGFSFVLTGALVGFLFHNRPPARLFMGDAGAYFVGYCLAVITILATFAPSGMPRHGVLVPLCILAVPLYDTVSVVCIRLRAGRSPFEGDTNHFSHRLVALGLSKSQAVATICLTSAACGLGALVLPQVNATGAVIVVLMIACLLSVIAILETTARRKMRS